MADEFVIKNGAIIKTGGTLTIGDPAGTGYRLPTTDGDADQALVTDGDGNVSFTTVRSIPAGTIGDIQYNDGAEGFAGDPNFNTDGSGNVSIVGSLEVDELTFNDTTILGVGDANDDILLETSGSGLILAKSGYDMSAGPNRALATKGYVDDATKNYIDSSHIGYKNWIINGQFNIWQRHVTRTGLSGWATDRWWIVCTTGDVTLSRLYINPWPEVGYCCMAIGVNTKPTTDVYLGQGIDSGALYILPGKTCTVSFWVRSNVASTQTPVSVRIIQRFKDDRSDDVVTVVGSYTITEVDSWEKKTFTFTVPLIVGHETTVNPYFDLDIGLPLRYITPATGYVYITGVQFEVGDKATPFEYRPEALEQQLCERYFQKSYNRDVAIGTNTAEGFMTSTAATVNEFSSGTINFRSAMRKIPTVVLYSYTTGATGTARNYSAGADVSIQALYIGERSAHVVPVTPGTLVAGNVYGWHWSADAE